MGASFIGFLAILCCSRAIEALIAVIFMTTTANNPPLHYCYPNHSLA